MNDDLSLAVQLDPAHIHNLQHGLDRAFRKLLQSATVGDKGV